MDARDKSNVVHTTPIGILTFSHFANSVRPILYILLFGSFTKCIASANRQTAVDFCETKQKVDTQKSIQNRTLNFGGTASIWILFDHVHTSASANQRQLVRLVSCREIPITTRARFSPLIDWFYNAKNGKKRVPFLTHTGRVLAWAPHV